jgi:hypothetical protein
MSPLFGISTPSTRRVISSSSTFSAFTGGGVNGVATGTVLGFGFPSSPPAKAIAGAKIIIMK